MNKVLVLSGLPASGKTTYARKLVKKGWKRVNKDDIRAMVDNGKYSWNNEKLVIEIRDLIIDLSLIHGFNVVVDDTNFEEKHFKQISFLASVNDAEIDIKKFDVPLDECINRDKERDKPVGEKVIRSMYERYIKPQKSQ